MATTQAPHIEIDISEKNLQPWERIAWTKSQEQIMYRNLGSYFYQRQQHDIALQYYFKSLNIKKDEANALSSCSLCKSDLAKCRAALMYALLAKKLEPNKPRNSKAINNAYYGLNQFEDLKIELHESVRKHNGAIINEFLKKISIVDEHLNDSLGDDLRPFLYKNAAVISEVAAKLKEAQNVKSYLIWKKRRDEGKCDVLSIQEEEPEMLSPIQIAKRQRTYTVFNQVYMGQSWKDVVFLRSISKNKNWCKSQFKESAPIMCELMATKCKAVKKFIKMLHARNPLYNCWVRKFPNRKLREKHHEVFLNYVQYKARRDTIIVLRKVKQYHKEGPVSAFAKYVEQVMGDDVVLKTDRIMPYKYEFMRQVYNTLALAFIDRFTVPPNFTDKMFFSKAMFYSLLQINFEHRDRTINFEFGNKSTSLALADNDTRYSAYKAYITRLEHRMIFAKYSIEKCYLWHSMADEHFRQAHYAECCDLSQKAIEESYNCNSNLWAFLCSMLIARSHAALNKIERSIDALIEAQELAKKLQNGKLTFFLETVLIINYNLIEMKRKSSRSIETLRKRRISVANNATNSNDEKDSRTPSDEISVTTMN